MLRGVFRQGDCGRQLPTVRGALTEMDHAVQQIRDRNMLADLPFEAPLRVLDLVITQPRMLKAICRSEISVTIMQARV